MPSLKDAIETDRSNLTPVEPKPVENKPPADQRLNSLLKSPYARCPLPPSNNSADSLRQWGQGSDVPKFRTQTPPSNVSGGTGGVTKIGVGTVNVGSSIISSIADLETAQNASITTPALVPNQVWTGSLQMAKVFTLLHVSSSAPCRVELYGTSIAQMLDIGRGVNQLPLSTTQGLILEVFLLTALSWQVLDCTGANGDSPQSSVIYITVTNMSAAVQAFTVSFLFVPEES